MRPIELSRVRGSGETAPIYPGCRRADIDSAEIILRYSEGETSDQIAASLGCSKSTVAIRLNRAGIAMRRVGTYTRLPRPTACPRCNSTERRSSGECANCARQRDRARQETITARNLAWRSRPENKARSRAYGERWGQENIARRRIQQRGNAAVLKAIADGRLVRPTVCESCDRKDVPIEAAHIDYTRPLDVRWLCRHCHRIWDRAEPKTLAGIEP